MRLFNKRQKEKIRFLKNCIKNSIFFEENLMPNNNNNNDNNRKLTISQPPRFSTIRSTIDFSMTNYNQKQIEVPFNKSIFFKPKIIPVAINPAMTSSQLSSTHINNLNTSLDTSLDKHHYDKKMNNKENYLNIINETHMENKKDKTHKFFLCLLL